jgi:hypothetical protein
VQQHEVSFDITIRLRANTPEAAQAWAALWLKQALSSARADQDRAGVNVQITLSSDTDSPTPCCGPVPAVPVRSPGLRTQPDDGSSGPQVRDGETGP